MRFLILTCLICVTVAQQKKPAVCHDGTEALVRGDLYCCVEDGIEYCCMRDDPYHCKRPRPVHRNLFGAREDENKAPLRPITHDDQCERPRVRTNELDEMETTTCRGIPVTRTAMATLVQRGGMPPRIYTLALAQSEGCGAPSMMAVRLAGVDPGVTYSVMVGESTACGGILDRAWEVARVSLPVRIGAVEVPSTVNSIRELRGLTVSLTSPQEQGPPAKTYACGNLVVVG